MARTPRLEMFRGDYRELEVVVDQPHHADAELHFGAKLRKDIGVIDSTDTNAVIKIDAVGATDSVDNGDGTTTFTLKFTEADTTGKTPGTYVGEIEYIDYDGRPATADQFDFILKGDVNQRA